jgi:hypothetical protein
MSMEEFKRSKEAEAAAEEMAEEGPAYYVMDKHGMPHFGKSKDEAAQGARTANEGYQ